MAVLSAADSVTNFPLPSAPCGIGCRTSPVRGTGRHSEKPRFEGGQSRARRPARSKDPAETSAVPWPCIIPFGRILVVGPAFLSGTGGSSRKGGIHATEAFPGIPRPAPGYCEHPNALRIPRRSAIRLTAAQDLPSPSRRSSRSATSRDELGAAKYRAGPRHSRWPEPSPMLPSRGGWHRARFLKAI